MPANPSPATREPALDDLLRAWGLRHAPFAEPDKGPADIFPAPSQREALPHLTINEVCKVECHHEREGYSMFIPEVCAIAILMKCGIIPSAKMPGNIAPAINPHCPA